MSVLNSSEKSEAKKRAKSAEKTTGGSAVEHRSASKRDDKKASHAVIPTIAAIPIALEATRTAVANHRLKSAQLEQHEIERSSRMRHSRQMSGGQQHSSTVGDVFAEIMERLRLEKIQKIIEKCQKRIERSRALGGMVANVAGGLNQMARTTSMKSVATGMRGATGGASREDATASILHEMDNNNDYQMG